MKNMWPQHVTCFCSLTFTGPENWEDFSSLCNGTDQSPVNIVTKKVVLDKSLTEFKLTGYQETFHSLLTNNGHTGKTLLQCSVILILKNWLKTRQLVSVLQINLNLLN